MASMDLIPYHEYSVRVNYLRHTAPPPLPGPETERYLVKFQLAYIGSSSRQFDAPPQLIPQHQFYAEGPEIARRMLVLYGWHSAWTDQFVTIFSQILSSMAPYLAADPLSNSDEHIMSFVLHIHDAMFPRRPAESWEGEGAVVMATAEAGALRFPADKAAVRALKEVEINGRDEDDVCSICLEEVGIGSKGLGMPCRHVFHSQCLLKWLDFDHVCPLCRYALPKQFH